MPSTRLCGTPLVPNGGEGARAAATTAASCQVSVATVWSVRMSRAAAASTSRSLLSAARTWRCWSSLAVCGGSAAAAASRRAGSSFAASFAARAASASSLQHQLRRQREGWHGVTAHCASCVSRAEARARTASACRAWASAASSSAARAVASSPARCWRCSSRSCRRAPAATSGSKLEMQRVPARGSRPRRRVAAASARRRHSVATLGEGRGDSGRGIRVSGTHAMRKDARAAWP
mmetsp:Transcript_62051/g.200070  ORF Transcript_62051/g.200070 Transcript_62051/m.200070 type:complete len:235 (+) Transcript_62051:232-936(+)